MLGSQAQSRQAPLPARCSGSAKGGASRPCGPVRRANHGSAPVLRPRSLGGFPSSVQREQILLVARDQFRIAVAAVTAGGDDLASGLENAVREAIVSEMQP